MGDRGNIVVIGKPSKVFLYGHWSRSRMPQITKEVLGRKQRWEDAQYLARILFCKLIDGDIKGETGFGISSVIGDGDETVIVCTDTQTVQIGDDKKTFEDFIK